MKVGDSFRIKKNTQWKGPNGPFLATDFPHISHFGSLDAPPLDLGKLVAFEHPDFFGRICEYVIPVEWIEPITGTKENGSHTDSPQGID